VTEDESELELSEQTVPLVDVPPPRTRIDLREIARADGLLSEELTQGDTTEDEDPLPEHRKSTQAKGLSKLTNSPGEAVSDDDQIQSRQPDWGQPGAYNPDDHTYWDSSSSRYRDKAGVNY